MRLTVFADFIPSAHLHRSSPPSSTFPTASLPLPRQLKLTFTAEVIDLTHPINVEVFRKWDQKEVAYTDLLRFIRISGAGPETATVSRPGKHPLLQPAQPQDSSAQSQDSSAQLQEHPSAEAHMDVDAT